MIFTGRKKDENDDQDIKTMMVKAFEGIEASSDFKSRVIGRIKGKTEKPYYLIVPSRRESG